MKNIFITWHDHTQGFAYLKHLLAEFFKKGVSAKKIAWTDIDFFEQENIFTSEENGFVFDKIYYLLPQKGANKQSKNNTKSSEEISEDKENIAEEQVKCFLKDSDANKFYTKKNFITENIAVYDLANPNEITKELHKFIQKINEEHTADQVFINLSLGTSETQVVWYALRQAGKLPENVRFLKTYTDKIAQNVIKEIETDIFDKPKPITLFDKPKSKVRLLADELMKFYINNGFMILILGERGVGKSALVEKYKAGKKIISANCASFDDDSKAESELFGHEKGAFTDAKEKMGLFEEANGETLFLDEIHHLSKRVQAKLMKALQTDENNNFNIRKLGSVKGKPIKCTVILASNHSIEQLRNEDLYEDFFDRVSQNVIHIPALRETPEDRITDWKKIWKQMLFGEEKDAPQDEAFIAWLKTVPLYGNFRDLQKIAIFWRNYSGFSPELKKLINEDKNVKTQFEYVRKEFELLQSIGKKDEVNPYFDAEKSIQEMQNHFNKELATWLNKKFGSMEKASKYFEEKFEKTVEVRTLYKWRNGK